MKNKINTMWGVPAQEFKNLCFDSQLKCVLTLLGLKTKEELIRYIVCDGEPADESCIGHPVLEVVDGLSAHPIFYNMILVGIEETENVTNRYKLAYDLIAYQECAHKNTWAKFVKKIPGYDYSKGIDK